MHARKKKEKNKGWEFQFGIVDSTRVQNNDMKYFYYYFISTCLASMEIMSKVAN
jgi:hypothetical protein